MLSKNVTESSDVTAITSKTTLFRVLKFARILSVAISGVERSVHDVLAYFFVLVVVRDKPVQRKVSLWGNNAASNSRKLEAQNTCRSILLVVQEKFILDKETAVKRPWAKHSDERRLKRYPSNLFAYFICEMKYNLYYSQNPFVCTTSFETFISFCLKFR